MNMFGANAIKWDEAPLHIISADEAHLLPSNIKAFKAAVLDRQVLRCAIDLCQDGVEVVQIEVPIDPEIQLYARKYHRQILSDYDTSDDDRKITPVPNLMSVVSRAMRSFNSVNGTQTEVHEAWGEVAYDMAIALRQAAPQGVADFFFHDNKGDELQQPYFHHHYGEDGKISPLTHVLNMVQSDVGTVFFDKAQVISKAETGESLKVDRDKPDLWAGKAWNYLLFSSKIWHSHYWDTKNRRTFVMPFGLESQDLE